MTALVERGSFRARAVRRLSTHTIRRLGALAPVNPTTLAAIRPLIDRTLRAAAPTLRGTAIRVVHGPVRGEWVYGPRATRTDHVVLYIHGGGFVAGSAAGYRGVAARISTATRMPVFTLGYRLAPEHPYPAAPLDVARGYRWLLKQGYRPEQVIVAGDSAGGFLAADLILAIGQSAVPQPGALVLFSPMTDLSLTLATGHANATLDGLLTVPMSRHAIAQFTDLPLELRPEPGMSLPPALIHTSDTEFFSNDATTLANRWTAAGAHCELQVWPDQMHVFQALPALIPESRFAYRAAGRFVTSILEPSTAAS
ncbi:alpha/beta hydrolase [Nocardia gipuzkoensis]|uniref:alpha/beta hydrolase n=1 Tax=Nocardia gipuzkoensis TaxID=2749991 RepID=UPI001E3ECA1A|nr:alpha/beta hydrolase [Nocardia gipuzkoensis]UGT67694.1 alpha/beta hydrolase [Nocardia gipuzkoensis]